MKLIKFKYTKEKLLRLKEAQDNLLGVIYDGYDKYSYKELIDYNVDLIIKFNDKETGVDMDSLFTFDGKKYNSEELFIFEYRYDIALRILEIQSECIYSLETEKI